MIKKERKPKKVMPILMAIIMLVSIMAPMAYALEKIDMSKPVTLSVQFTGELTKVPGMPFKAYRLASITENAELAFVDKFAGYGVELPEDQAGYRALAETMSGYIARDGIAPDKVATTNENGRASFAEVEKGLYLITADRFKVEATGMTYIVSPSLVVLPNTTDGETWLYDVVISPKYTEIPPVPDTPGKVDINVIKVWKNEADQTKRPSEIIAELICQDKVIDSVKLNAANNWRHTWKDLDGSYEYKVTEKVVPSGYTVTIVKDGNTFTITNSGGGTPPPTPPRTPRLPQTGQLWWPVPILAGAGLIFLIAGIIRKKTA